MSAQEQSRLSMLHLVGGVARVGRAEGVEEEVIERKRKKKNEIKKNCADTKVPIFSGKKTKKNFFVRKERLEYTFFWLISWLNETMKEHCESVCTILCR